MDTNVTISDKLNNVLTEYTKIEIFSYSLIIGTVLGMLIQGLIGLKGILILSGIYFIMRYYNKGNKEK